MPDPSNSELFAKGLAAFTERLVSSTDVCASDNGRASYDSALNEFISGLLAPLPREDENRPGGSTPNHQFLVPEQVGALYEYLRSFHFKQRAAAGAILVPNISGRRNQGLFYTPDAIVGHIIKRSLEAFGKTRLEDYLKFKVLDPSVGAGRFLVCALNIIVDLVKGLDASEEELAEMLIPPQSVPDCPGQFDVETLIKIHLVENCLYGVDIDPIAVEITKAALRREVFGASSQSFALKMLIKRGNSLIGSVRPKETEEALPLWPELSAEDNLTRFNWFEHFPKAMAQGGFDLIVGNPPYEILSVKESGIHERKWEQKYFRSHYKTCSGKLNTYRLMLERSFSLLRDGGALGFIVPMTFLADTSATELRKLILDNAGVRHLTLISEKAKVFENVTQALAILVITKGGATDTIIPRFAAADGLISDLEPVEITRELIDRCDLRIPIIRSEEDKRFLEMMTRIPPFRGAGDVERVATVHQGEINLTTCRRFITTDPTAYPLVRGEHVAPLSVKHPAGTSRLDWVSPTYAERRSKTGAGASLLEHPWEHSRIVLARVVNMNTRRRLKAAPAPAGWFLGDMTNYFASNALPENYLLGLLNSRVLNHRLKLTSTNNYISAAEVEALPIPRIECFNEPDSHSERLFDKLAHVGYESISHSVQQLRRDLGPEANQRLLGSLICRTVETLTNPGANNGHRQESLWTLLDASVALLYGVDFYSSVFDSDLAP